MISLVASRSFLPPMLVMSPAAFAVLLAVVALPDNESSNTRSRKFRVGLSLATIDGQRSTTYDADPLSSCCLYSLGLFLPTNCWCWSSLLPATFLSLVFIDNNC